MQELNMIEVDEVSGGSEFGYGVGHFLGSLIGSLGKGAPADYSRTDAMGNCY